jgi:glycosyltransferase involved in cell wall biosynthesis
LIKSQRNKAFEELAMLDQILPRVSLVVPSFNEPLDVLRASLDSVVAQTMSDFECLVVDESTDVAAAANCRNLCARDPRFHYIRPDNRIGLAASLNLGISKATAPYIARFDSDDICLPQRLERQLAFMDNHPEIDVLGAGLDIFGDDGGTLAHRHYPTDPDEIERKFQTTTAVAHPTVMMRKAVVDQFGGYDASFRFAEDLELWLRLLNNGVRFANLSEILVKYRQQSTRRDPMNWRFNLLARTKNFSSRQLPRRLFGLAAISMWQMIPPLVQEQVFHRVLLRKG